MTDRPKIVDDDHNCIQIMLGGRELQAWFYANETERKGKMRQAWSFCDGFLAAREVYTENAEARR